MIVIILLLLLTLQFGTPVCGLCEEELNSANLQKERWKEEALVQRNRLMDLFGEKDRPKWSKKTTLKVSLCSHFLFSLGT